MPLKILHIEQECTGCSACTAVCPKGALTLSYDEEGFYVPHLNIEKCVDCKACERVCQVLHNSVPDEPSCNYTAFMIKAQDKEIVRKSSSGGAFSLLADSVLQQGGVVFGARYNYDKECLEHCSTEHCSIGELRKSKYIESFVGDTFKEVEKYLRDGKKVMYCGTPCQIEGLYHFVQMKKLNISNILLVRFVCHGVPSNKFFTEYKHYEEQKHRSKMTHFDFRPKTRGWKSADWLMRFENGKEDKGPSLHYYYYYYFACNYLLRRSCYSCRRVFHEIADLTIADFWAINKYQPDNKDQEGISLCLVHTNKGEAAIGAVKEHDNVEQIPIDVLDNIYREARCRGADYEFREKEMKAVLQSSYMMVAVKRLRKKIIINKTKDILADYIRPLMIWRRRK